MPPIYQLNHPPHPFWDFVQEMNDHPFWQGRAQAPPPPPPMEPDFPQQENIAAAAAATAAAAGEKNEQIPADDPPEVDPATLEGEQCKHARRCARRCGREHRRGHEGFRRGGWPFGGPPAFGLGGGPFGGPRAHHPHGPPPFGFPGRGGHAHRGGPHPHPHPHPHGGPHHHGGPRGHHHHPPPPPPHAGPGFNLGKFLNDLGDRIGVDLNGAAQGLGFDRFMPSSSSPDVDFEPKVDIFDLATEYVIHAALPGARKDDVGVDWDGEHNVLRIAGVVHRPDANEDMLQRLVVDGRKREVGVFEKNIRLGTRREPASIDIAGIKAKMSDGILVIRVPKIEKEHHKRDVPISSATPSPPRYEQPYTWEDEEMYDDAPEGVQNHHAVLQPQVTPASRTVSVEPQSREQPPAINEKASIVVPIVTEKGKSKEAEAEQEKSKHVAAASVEALPVYHTAPTSAPAHDWDESGSEEGDYVKINVD